MTRAEVVLNLLRGQSLTFEELTKLTGFTDPIVRNAIDDLRRSGYIQSIPMTFHATPKGQEEGKPKIDWRKPSKKRVRKPKAKKSAVEKIVALSLKRRPALEEVWRRAA